MPLRYKVKGRTDVGLVRPGNEDYLHLDETNHVFAVCDGMGGHQAGEVASMTASTTIKILHTSFRQKLLSDKRLLIERTLPPSGDLLLRSIRLANRNVFNKALTDTTLSGMGTTVVSVALDKDMMSVAHVGDSRAYRLDQGALIPLTTDHSWVHEIQENQDLTRKEAESVVGKNVITRALGVRETVEIDYRLTRIRAGDIYIMCSDGLCGFADDEEIFEVANKERSNLKAMVDNLVQMANDRGGSDNVTVIALQIEEVPTSDLPEVDVFTLPAENTEELSAENEWVETINQTEEKLTSDDSSHQSDGSGRSKLFLVLIFVIFVVVAFAIIYFSDFQK
ncbi:MAG: protein phosphatase 2C domain-containing protein [candidate division Zixibacteria bacterium]|nr:protein phosphatase 2C domain-containing protein [candidate division Zixibacteria bacterium]